MVKTKRTQTAIVKTMMPDVKFYTGRRDTRWDVYPNQEPEVAIAHDWWGFWAYSPSQGWYKSPASYVLGREISRQEAEQWPVTEVK